HYGEPEQSKGFFKIIEGLPVVITTGFMTDDFIASIVGKLTDRQREADQIAEKFGKANILHFHTEGGRQRFLKLRPEFEEKTISIPFLLPNLSLFEKLDKFSFNEGEPLTILFVGYDGRRKGLHELIAVLDALGPKYLKFHNVNVKIV